MSKQDVCNCLYKIDKWVIKKGYWWDFKTANILPQTSTFPSKEKIVKAILLYKKREWHHFTNDRHVSLLPQFSKVLEKVATDRLDKLLYWWTQTAYWHSARIQTKKFNISGVNQIDWGKHTLT